MYQGSAKGPTPNTIILGIRFSMYEIGGRGRQKHLDHSTMFKFTKHRNYYFHFTSQETKAQIV